MEWRRPGESATLGVFGASTKTPAGRLKMLAPTCFSETAGLSLTSKEKSFVTLRPGFHLQLEGDEGVHEEARKESRPSQESWMLEPHQ